MEPRTNYATANVLSAKTPRLDDMPTAASTLTSTAGHVAMNLAKSHEMLDELEGSLLGNAGRSAKDKDVGPRAPCLDTTLSELAESSASLAFRLESIASRIGRGTSR